jgi:hypothetical protein
MNTQFDDITPASIVKVLEYLTMISSVKMGIALSAFSISPVAVLKNILNSSNQNLIAVISHIT